jgi:4-hydroxybenzoate polyprenyltransferase/phosphoserine phosphatase
LLVDVDGTLLKTDLLLESFWAALGQHPLACLRACFTMFFRRPALKQRLAELAQLDVTRLPMRPEVLDVMQAAKADGRVVGLASGGSDRLVRPLSLYLNLTPAPLASQGELNLTGPQKAEVLTALYGVHGFEYIGDSSVDIPVWQAGSGGYIAAPAAALLRRTKAAGLALKPLGRPAAKLALVKALRPHQWVKNILLFLPLVAAHRSDIAGLWLALWGIAVFSAAASCIYIVNDLLDLAADRQHDTKKARPFASGDAKILSGMGLMVALAVVALGGAALHSPALVAIIALYMGLSFSYSLLLKRLRWVDITTLAALYTLRVVAGAVVVGVPMSGWLGAFIFPVFLALGGVKRLIELGKAKDDSPLPGRGYARHDRADLRNISITAAVGAIVVYTLYTYSDIAASLYQNLWELRLAAIPVALWLGRMIYRGWQGRMNYDPIVFALRDPIGLALMAIGGFMLVQAAG